MIEKAYAKINLSLDIKDLRDDGYHNLETIMLPIELHDSLEISKAARGAIDDFVTCDDYSLKVTKYNLVHQIIDAARAKYGFKDRFIVNIHKNIFLQAGLGGGSADAAAALKAILKIENIKPTDEELIDLAIKIGSDVPWSIFNKPTLLKRKGEVLEFIDHTLDCGVLLVKPLDGLSTKEVFAKADEIGEVEHGDINEIIKLYEANDIEGLGQKVFNSLEKPAIELLPEVKTVIESLKADDFKCVKMSGAGSCVFALSTDIKLLKNAEKKYSKGNYQVALTKFLRS